MTYISADIVEIKEFPRRIFLQCYSAHHKTSMYTVVDRAILTLVYSGVFVS